MKTRFINSDFWVIVFLFVVLIRPLSLNAQTNEPIEKNKEFDLGLAYRISNGIMFSSGYELNMNKHFHFKISGEMGLFGKYTEPYEGGEVKQDFYVFGVIPEIKYYPIKRVCNNSGFYITAYTGAFLTYKIDNYYQNGKVTDTDNNTGILLWDFGLGAGYKVNVFKGLFIEPTIGLAYSDLINLEYIAPEFTLGLNALPLLTRFQVKVGYSF